MSSVYIEVYVHSGVNDYRSPHRLLGILLRKVFKEYYCSYIFSNPIAITFSSYKFLRKDPGNLHSPNRYGLGLAYLGQLRGRNEAT